MIHFMTKTINVLSAVGVLATILAMGCTECVGEEPAGPHSEETYLALDSTPFSASKWRTGFKASAADGWRFGAYREPQDTYRIVIKSPDNEDDQQWELRLRAPNNAPFEPGLYKDAQEPLSDAGKPWLSLTVGSTVPTYSSGWYRIHEADFAADRTHFSVDFFLVQNSGEKVFGRLRYHARVDPVPTDQEVTVHLYGERGAALRRLGFEPVQTPGVLGLQSIFFGRHRRHADSHEEFMKEVIGPVTSYLPKVEEGKELWYDPESQQLYIRAIGQEAPVPAGK
jgi:hypothetical protein